MSKINPDDRRMRGPDYARPQARAETPQAPADAKRKVESEVKGQVSSAELYGNLAASGQSVSGTQFAEFFRLALVDKFGKTGEDAFNNITNALRSGGKKLDFGLVKSAVLGAANRNGDNMKDVQAKLDDLDKGDAGNLGKGADTVLGMNSAIAHLTDRYDPTRILAFMELSRRLTYQFIDNLKDNQFQEEAKQQLLKRAELKEDEQKEKI